MIKSVLIFLIALSVGIGAAVILSSSNNHATNFQQSPPPRAQQIAQSNTTRTLRPFGPQTTNKFVESCTGRCRCSAYYVTETVAKPGIVTASTEFDVGVNRVARCPGIAGTHNRAPVTGTSNQCYVCPSGMIYSRQLRGGEDLLRRWGFNEHVCVKIDRQCAN